MSDHDTRGLWQRFLRKQGVRADMDEIRNQHIGGDAPAVSPLDRRENGPTGASAASHGRTRDMPMQVLDESGRWVEYGGDAHGMAGGGAGRDMCGRQSNSA